MYMCTLNGFAIVHNFKVFFSLITYTFSSFLNLKFRSFEVVERLKAMNILPAVDIALNGFSLDQYFNSDLIIKLTASLRATKNKMDYCLLKATP